MALGVAAAVALLGVPEGHALGSMRRSVVLLYTSQGTDAWKGEQLLDPLEAMLEHLGMVSYRWDLAKGLPDPRHSAEAWGVVSLLPCDHASDSLPVTAWLNERARAAQPVVAVTGSGHPSEKDAPPSLAASSINPFSHEVRWRGDPYRFLEQGLNLEHVPRLDPTTVNGQRVFFSSVDSTGFTALAVRQGRPCAAEVVRDMILSATSLPISVSVAPRELAGHPRLEAIARSILALPNVEAASTPAPFSRALGNTWLASESASDGARFTHDWTGPFNGQLRVLDIFQATETPRRLAPVELGYSFLAGAHIGSTRALQHLYRWAANEPLCPVFASYYARMVQGFYNASVLPLGPGVWQIANEGACRTVRFDDEPGAPDLGASIGVAGFQRSGRALYVHLAADPARIVLAPEPSPHPHLQEANAPLVAWSEATASIRAEFDPTVPLRLVLSGFAPNQPLRVRAQGIKRPAQADARGDLRLSFPVSPREFEVAW